MIPPNPAQACPGPSVGDRDAGPGGAPSRCEGTVLAGTSDKAPAGLPSRVASLDAYRGFVMLLMMGEVLDFAQVARAVPGSSLWQFLAYQQSHVAWVGCTLHDLIQPSFSFLVGVALPFSLARRTAEGQTEWRRTLHAFWRALVLVLLGVFLRSFERPQTNWTFEDTLTQIGLGYGFLYLLALRTARVQWAALALLLCGYWLAFALFPLPGAGFNWAETGTRADWAGNLGGFAAHWNKNTNLAWRFDTWFLNLFPREKAFTHNGGGYATLSFIPTLGTMVLGLIAGGVLRSDRQPLAKLRWLALAGAAGLAAGWLCGALGICPVVKRLWTPSWVLFSGGWCCLLTAAFYLVIEVWRLRKWAFVLVVVGMNSIAAYLIAHLCEHFIKGALPRHLGSAWFKFAGPAFEPLLLGAGVLLVEWLLLWWMYRRRIFLRV
jgi:heparan-alpha-glucosaminide N-acetyltransferase